MSDRMYIDIHILQSLPPSNVNRDDTGSPKTAIYGGSRRARVSSQAWKRATRKRFNSTLNKSELGYRTKRLAELLGDLLTDRVVGLGKTDAYALASAVFAASGIKMTTPKAKKGEPAKPDESGYLIFLSAAQLDALAELAANAHSTGELPDKKRVKQVIDTDHSIDVALFGRMVADDADLNVDASVQVAHALGVQAVEQEFDYFTAVDDFHESRHETGAGMIGTIEFNSSTLYRYATINVAGLAANLGDLSATSRAAATFVESFALSMPTGKLNTFANNVVPDAVLICIRDDQPVNLVGAFEEAIEPAVGSGVLSQAAQSLASRESDVAAAYGGPTAKFFTAVNPAADALAEVGERLSIAELVARVSASVTTELSAPA
ncbi:type I-E CRISPR-associated protein Cas7/Cse4/CasC [Gordonia sp. DT101]|uniref:type I-E CRISPR-associated protein Cas7/Cse4/CasC n=1 Tax=Gordonia sp. DT101 TaxID=3416545 RepID=UPI003CEEC759